MARQLFLFVRMAGQLAVLALIIFSLLTYWPGSRLMVPVLEASVRSSSPVPAGMATLVGSDVERSPARRGLGDSVTLGELGRRMERVEGIGLEHRLAQLETRVAGNTTLLWTALCGLGALVLETFGRMGMLLVARARHQPR